MYDPSIYDAAYFEKGLRPGHVARVERMVQWTVAEFGPFKSALDLGAGRGIWSQGLTKMGSEVWAVDFSEDALNLMPAGLHKLKHDLRNPLDLGRTFDLVLCIEVAEHLPESAASVLCETIAKHCARLAVLTAAPPGQGGTGHVNCQPPSYWKEKMNGLVYLPEETEEMRQGWEKIASVQLAYLPRNLMVFGNVPALA